MDKKLQDVHIISMNSEEVVLREIQITGMKVTSGLMTIEYKDPAIPRNSPYGLLMNPLKSLTIPCFKGIKIIID